MSALGIKSLHITPTPAGNLDSRYTDGNDGGAAAPSVPVLGTPTVVSSTSLDIPLSVASSGASTPITYVLQKSTSEFSGFTDAATGDIFAGDGVATVTGLTQSTTYYFRCKGVGANLRESGYSATVSLATPATGADVTAPGAPSNLQTPTIGSSSVILTWGAATDNVGVTGYDILRGTGDGAGNPVGSGTIIGTVSGTPAPTTFTNTGLTASQEYYWRVRAKDAAGNVGAYTSRKFATTAAAAVAYTVYDDFEAATLDQNVWVPVINRSSGNTGTDVVISTAAALSGTRCRKSIITRLTTADYRAETDVKPTSNPPGVTHFNEDCWYGVAIMLDPNWVQSAGQDILSQWHTYPWLETPEESGTSPTVYLAVNSSLWRVGRRWNPVQQGTPSTQQGVSQGVGGWQGGVWVRWVFCINWHWINGRTRVWRDDVLVYDVTGGNCSNDLYAPYWKFGNYRISNNSNSTYDANANPRIVYHDNARCILNTTADHYNDVRP